MTTYITPDAVARYSEAAAEQLADLRSCIQDLTSTHPERPHHGLYHDAVTLEVIQDLAEDLRKTVFLIAHAKHGGASLAHALGVSRQAIHERHQRYVVELADSDTV